MRRPLLYCVLIIGLCSPIEQSVGWEEALFKSLHESPKRVWGNSPCVGWEEALFKSLPDIIDAITRAGSRDKKEQYREEEEQQQEQQQQEQRRRERQRAEQAERNEAAAREEAYRERQRAEQAERNEAAAREEAHRSRQTVEEARSNAQQALDSAEEAQDAAREAKGIAQDAQDVAQQAETSAQQAQQVSQAAKEEAVTAKGTAQQAIGVADEAKSTAQQAIGAATEAQKQVQETHLRVGRQNVFVTMLGLLALLALILAMRKPRQALGQAMQPLSRRLRSAQRNPSAGTVHAATAGLVLTGFDGKGRPANIPLPEPELDPDQGGFTLGRHHLLVDKALDDERLSKRHVRFSRNGKGYFIEDLNSRNGTVINSTQPCAPFKPMPIRPGDTVQLGGMELTVSA